MLNLSQRLAFAANVSAARSMSEMWSLRANASIPAKISKAALIDLPARSQNMRYLINRLATKDFDGYRPIGGRGEQIVMVCGQKVLKLVACLHDVEYSSLEDAAHRLQTESDRCQEYLGKRWTSTNFDVVRTKKNGNALLTAAQPRIYAAISYKSINEIRDDQRLARHSRQEFAEATQALYDATGLYPDLLGTDNIFGINDGYGLREMKVIDTIPINQTRHGALHDQTPYTVRECIERDLEVLSN